MIVNYCGSLNGYVGVEPGHPLWGVEYDSSEVFSGSTMVDIWNINVHGGITWAGPFNYINEKIWWIGFDTGHLGDWSFRFREGKKWTVEEIREQISAIIVQLVGV